MRALAVAIYSPYLLASGTFTCMCKLMRRSTRTLCSARCSHHVWSVLSEVCELNMLVESKCLACIILLCVCEPSVCECVGVAILVQ